MTPLLITIPVCASDILLVKALLHQITALTPPPNHGVLFVADHSLPNAALDEIAALARPIFPVGGRAIHAAVDVAPAWPNAFNFRFETAARYVASEYKMPWLFLDPRCVPTRKSWLFDLEKEYFNSKKQIMGALLTPAGNGTALKFIAAPSIYPAELPKRMMQRLISQRGTPFEQSCAELIMPIAHGTNLIWTHSVNGTSDLPKPPASAVLVHTAQAIRYAATLRGETPAPEKPVEVQSPANGTPVAPEEKPAAEIQAPVSVTNKPAYYHSGNLGDVIYALSAIKLAGGGKLLLGPRVKRTTPPPDHPIKSEVFHLLKPLLSMQAYLTSVNFIDRYPGTDQAFDLNNYREVWSNEQLREKLSLKSIASIHCHMLGVLEKHHPHQTWLTAPSPIRTDMWVISRSSRHQDANFPWAMICEQLRKRLLFIGLPGEHSDFQRQFKIRTAFWNTQDFLEMARLITGSRGFIGNQSFPCALAIALGVPVCQEVFPTKPDCLFPRPNFLSSPFTRDEFINWTKL